MQPQMGAPNGQQPMQQMMQPQMQQQMKASGYMLNSAGTLNLSGPGPLIQAPPSGPPLRQMQNPQMQHPQGQRPPMMPQGAPAGGGPPGGRPMNPGDWIC